MEVAHIDAFERDPARFWGFYRQRLQMLGEKKPNAPITPWLSSSAAACWRR